MILLGTLLLLLLPPSVSSSCTCVSPWQSDMSMPSSCGTWLWNFCEDHASPVPSYCTAMIEDPDNFMTLFLPKLSELGTTCSKPYVTTENYDAMLRDDFLSYDRGTVALMFMLQGQSMGLNAETNPTFPDLMYEADMYGQRALKATGEEMRDVGFTDGNAYKVTLIRKSYYEPRQCTCVTDAWMETGPTMVCLQSLCNPVFGGDSELPFCSGSFGYPDPTRSLSVIESAEAFGTFEELAVNCGVPYFTYESLLGPMGYIPNPRDWSTSNVAAMFAAFGSMWLGLDAVVNPDMGDISYTNNINGNKFMTITADELFNMGFSLDNAKKVVDGRENSFGKACSCVDEAWFGGGHGPRPPTKCLSYLRVECMKDGSLPFCDMEVFDYTVEPPYNTTDPSFHANFSALAFDTVAEIAQECGVDWVTRENYNTAFSGEVQISNWNTGAVALMVLVYGDMEMGINAKTNPGSAHTFYNNDVSGERFMLLDPEAMTGMGITDGSGSNFVRTRNDYYGFYAWPPSDIRDDAGVRMVNDQFNVSITFILDKLLNLDEPAFSFEAELTVIVSWEDERIFKRCDNTGINGHYLEGDPCALFWKPTLKWNNMVLLDDPDAVLKPSSIEDLGFTSRVGESVMATDGLNSPGLEKSIGYQAYKVRGTFMGDYYFQQFPYDQQELNITIQMPDLPLRKAKFVTRADAVPSSAGAGDLPLWETTCVSSSVDTVDENDKGTSAITAGDDPFGTYMAKLDDLDQATGISEMFAHQDVQANAETDNMEAKLDVYENYRKWSTVTLTIQVKRKPDFYLYNFVLVVALLVFVSFFSFHMEKSSLGDRLGLTLTIVLGLNVFQIVIIDNMPATGYLTNMHSFLLASTEIVMVVAVENLIVNAASKRRATLESTLNAFLTAVDNKPTTKVKGVEMKEMDSNIGNTLLGGTRKDSDLESNLKTNPMFVKGLKKFKSNASSDGEEDSTGGDEEPDPTFVRRSKKFRAFGCCKSWNKIIYWVDDYLDVVSTIVFPIVFAYFYMKLGDEGEMGDEGVVQNRCQD